MRLSITQTITGLALGAALTGCTVDDGARTSGPSSVTLAVTDAASDELSSFVAEVTAVQLTRVGGATVGVLPQSASIDFVTLEETSQVLNIANVPPGLYTAASVTFDFTSAEAYLVGEAAPATLLDGDGNPLPGTLTLPVTIGNLLNAVAGRNRILELDFDLDQSIMVDATNNTVQVEPALVFRVDRTDPKDMFVVGELQSVDSAASTIEIELQTLAGTAIRDLTVSVDAGTVYQVDGAPARGAPGLAAVEALAAGTWIQCYGDVNPFAATIDASYVEAGAGTYNGGGDIVEGHVVGRVGGAGADATLTVLGHSNDASHTSFFFNSTFTVSTSFLDTNVVRRGGASAFDTDDVNVGQRVRVFGTLSGFNLDATSASSVLRMQQTRALGYAAGAVQGTRLEVDLERIGLRHETLFNWSEGGATPVDANAFDGEVGSLASGLGIGMGTAVELDGFFTAVDDGGADFVATRVVNRDLAPSLMAVHDRDNGLTVTPTVDASAITLAIQGTAVFGEIAIIDRGFVGVTPLPTTPDPSIVPAGAFGWYTIRDRNLGGGSLHLTFDAFTTALDALLAQGAELYNVTSIGTYDAPTNRITSGLTTVVVD